MLKSFLHTTIVLGVLFAFLFPAVTMGAPLPSDPDTSRSLISDPSGSVKLANPLGVNTFCGLIKAFLDGAMLIGLPVAVLFIVIAGFRFIWARGNPEQLKVAKYNLLYTIVGIGVFFGAWTLASLITNTINEIGSGKGIEACK